MNVPVITTLIAKVLNIIERLLDEWVSLNISSLSNFHDTGSPFVDNCGPNVSIVCNMTDCGNDFVERLEDGIHLLASLLSYVLAGIGVQETITPDVFS